jgi:hypothetical protein
MIVILILDSPDENKLNRGNKIQLPVEVVELNSNGKVLVSKNNINHANRYPVPGMSQDLFNSNKHLSYFQKLLYYKT